MSRDLEVRVAEPDERLPVYRMLELYQHDLSDIWDQDLDLHGEYGYALDRYWQRSDCWPYVFRVGGQATRGLRSSTGGYASRAMNSGWISSSS